MKRLLLFGVLALSINAFGQSKKEQIVALNYSIDSLNTVLSTARDKSSKDIQGLNYEIAQLKSDMSSLESSTTKLTNENEKLKLDMEKMSMKNLELEAELKAIEAERAILNIPVIAQNINFEKYPSGPIGSNKLVKINKSINKHAVGQLEYGIEKGYALRYKIDFASYYNIFTYGVGTGCSQGVMIDLRDGTVYSLPIECPACLEGPDEDIDYRKNSLLFVNTYCPNQSYPDDGDPDDGVKKTEKYLWSEKMKKFIKTN